MPMLLAAAVALVLVHGFGRFVYTPLLPLLVDDGLISLTQAAMLASWNYIGYLLGALLALFLYQRKLGRIALLAAIFINVLSTLLQTLATSYEPLAALRLINGISNGVVFALAPALVLEWLVEQGRSHLSGLMYLGVGIGILLSSLSVDMTASFLTNEQRWLPAALASIPLAIWAIWQLQKLPNYAPVLKENDRSTLWDKATTPPIFKLCGRRSWLHSTHDLFTCGGCTMANHHAT